jgi:hypothetical protein
MVLGLTSVRAPTSAVKYVLRTAILAAGMMMLAACARKETISIGGSWEIVWVSSPFPEAGGQHPFLWRHSKKTHVLVEGDTYTYKYIPDDCVLYVSLDSGHLGAACGDRARERLTDGRSDGVDLGGFEG